MKDANAVAILDLTYKLSRMQRVVNPPERLVYAFSVILMILMLLLVIFQHGAWPVGVSVTGIIALLFILLLRGPLRSLFLSVTSDEYINKIMITQGYIYFGINEATDKWDCSFVTVSCGLCNTLLIRGISGAIVIPSGLIKYTYLKDTIDRCSHSTVK